LRDRHLERFTYHRFGSGAWMTSVVDSPLYSLGQFDFTVTNLLRSGFARRRPE
jgi:hypothetical protein